MLPRRLVRIIILLTAPLAVIVSANARGLPSPVGFQSSFTLAATPSQLAPGGQLTVSWTAPSGRPTTDWIALYKVGDANTTYGSWQYTQAAISGSFAVTAPAQTGRYEFRYLLQDGYTDIVRSTMVPITAAPSSSITSPSNNATFNAPVNITINATASDGDGISKVEFFQGSVKLGESSTSPYSFVWNSVAGGGYGLTAKTTDNLGAVTTSSTVNITVNPASEVIYFYDELGRLVAVIDRDGNAAGYAYDAVGNLLSISRQSPSQVSIIGFDPKNGLAASSVNIYGTGFSATAGQNSLTFNGVAANVLASSTTLIVASVPGGATTGPISVTSPIGSATSSASFTVGAAASAAPSITSFTPSIGVAGSGITITGTNFDTTITRVSFNAKQSTPSSATPTSIATTVPSNTTSGRISVATALGKATSSADFFAPPSPYTAADVGFTGRMAIGENRVVTIATANKIGLMLFDGVAGQKVSFNIVPVTISLSYEYIYKPDGTILVSSGFVSTSGKFIDTFALPVTGTYTILINAQQYTGNLTLSLYNIVDASGTISPGGPSVPIVFAVPGQNGSLTFTGTQGQRVSLLVTNVTTTGSVFHTITFYKPDGTPLATIQEIRINSYLDAQTLPASGTYTIIANPSDSATGNWTLSLYDVAPDVTGTITPGGASVAISVTSPGQNGRLTFTGTTGQRICLNMTGVTIGTAYVSISKPDSTNLVYLVLVSISGKFIDTLTLPANGTYTILVDPSITYTGNMTLTLYNVLADFNGAISPGGAPVTVTTTTPGQNGLVTFTGSAGQWVSLKMTSVTINSSYVNIYKPDGTILAAASVTTTGAFSDTVTLPVAGTYSIIVDPQITYTGSMTLTLYDVVNFSGSTTVGGSSVTVTLNTPGQNGNVTFSGTSGQQVTVRVTTNTIAGVAVSLRRPDETQLTIIFTSGSSFNLLQQTLGTTGTYTIGIDPIGSTTGSLTVSVTSP